LSTLQTRLKVKDEVLLKMARKNVALEHIECGRDETGKDRVTFFITST
jgi:hypothetical protein